jgi:putative colanic acid biosynthesis glycosyltransferase
MKILQINTILNSGSTGRIAEAIGRTAMDCGNQSYIAYGRKGQDSASESLAIGKEWDMYKHGIISILFDRHGFSSQKPTEDLIDKIKEIQPDIIGLHNLHGYYLHIGVLFSFLKKANIPVVWTLHDSWPYTGHCTYYQSVLCNKWQTECYHCPKKKYYPSSYFLDQSKRNFLEKKNLYAELKNLYLVTPSEWLANEVKKSFLKNRPLQVIHNGVDIIVFQPKEDVPKTLRNIDKKIILGVASLWDQRKGLDDFRKLSMLLPNNYQIVLVGLNADQLRNLPPKIIGISRTESVDELSQYYSAAEAFINPTAQDNFPTTNIEALACGTPVITYRTGGSPEAIDENTGRVVDTGDIEGLIEAILELSAKPRQLLRRNCRERAVQMFNKDERYQDYIKLYASVTR